MTADYSMSVAHQLFSNLEKRQVDREYSHQRGNDDTFGLGEFFVDSLSHTRLLESWHIGDGFWTVTNQGRCFDNYSSSAVNEETEQAS
jgi:hypothetical protein